METNKITDVLRKLLENTPVKDDLNPVSKLIPIAVPYTCRQIAELIEKTISTGIDHYGGATLNGKSHITVDHQFSKLFIYDMVLKSSSFTDVIEGTSRVTNVAISLIRSKFTGIGHLIGLTSLSCLESNPTIMTETDFKESGKASTGKHVFVESEGLESETGLVCTHLELIEIQEMTSNRTPHLINVGDDYFIIHLV